MSKCKEIMTEAAKFAGDDQMTLNEAEEYLRWLNDFCQWVYYLVPISHLFGLVDQSADLTQAAGKEDVTLPADFGRLLGGTRDTETFDIIEDPIAFEELYSTTSSYFKVSDKSPVATLWYGVLKVKPVGAAETGSIVVITHLKKITNRENVLPFSEKLRPAAVSYVSGRAISAESDTEAIAASKARLEEAGLLLAGV